MADYKQLVTIEQGITAGGNWDGSAPSANPTTSGGVSVFAPEAAGGLFDFDRGRSRRVVNKKGWDLWEVSRIVVDFNGVATKGIYIRKSGSPDIPIYESTSATEKKVLITDKLLLASDEKIAITSSGATLAMYARVTGRPVTSEW